MDNILFYFIHQFIFVIKHKLRKLKHVPNTITRK